MQDRLGQGPHVVFGLANPTPEDVRAAFLALTKVYHPARFARMSVEIQRLSNEVFLGIKGALDSITKSLPGAPPTRGTGSNRQLTPPAATSQPIARPASSQPIARPAISQPIARSAGMRPGTPPSNTPTPITRPATSPAMTSGPIPRSPARMPSASPSPAPMAIAPRAAGPSAAPPIGVRFNAAKKTSPGIPVLDERGQLVIAHDMIQKQQWAAAKTALDTLVQLAPESKQYRALVCYASARQAQAERRDGDARVELQQALQIDPDLTVAKTALAELFNRRK